MLGIRDTVEVGLMRRLVISALAFVIVSCGGTTATSTATPTAAITSAAPATTAASAATTAKPATSTPAPLFTDATFTGTWTNTTFGSTGNATFDVKVNASAATLAITITLTGNVFGAPAPAPESFTIPISATGATYTGKSKTFGDVTATLKDGTITFKGENVPGGRVKTIDGTGTYATTAITMNYSVGLTDGSNAKGTVALKKS